MSWSLRRIAGAGAAVALGVVATASPATARSVDDPMLGKQWPLAKIGAAQAWDTATGKGTVIAVIDSGVDLGHQDLAGKLLPGRDFTGTGSVQDDCGHGTHVAGTAAAATNNRTGVAGVAPDAKILPVKVLVPNGDRCAGDGNDIAAAIRWATDQGATVINLSLGSDIQFLTGSGFTEELDYAWSKGSIPVVAAGNQYIFGSGYVDEPAIVVTATTPDDRSPTYSSTSGGARWAMSAPGGAGTGDEGDVLSTYFQPGRSNQYAFLAGTSMATPHVSAAAAVLRSMGLTPQQTVDRLLATAADLGSKGKDNLFGSGRLDMAKAVGPPAGVGTATTNPATTAAPRGGGGATATTRRSAGRSGTTTAPSTGSAGTAPPGAPAPEVQVPVALPLDDASPPPSIVLGIDDGPAADIADDGDGRPTGLAAAAAVGLLATAGATGLLLRRRAGA